MAIGRLHRKLGDRGRLIVTVAGVGYRFDAPRADTEDLGFGDLRIDQTGHRAWIDVRTLRLTPTEFWLLCELARHPGETRSRQQLCGDGGKPPTTVQAVRAHITRLRRKLGPHWWLIATVPGGYRFDGHLPGP